MVAGPAVVVQDDTTTIIEPDFRGAVDRFGNILIEEA
jgi:N-methylhydantoinase A